MWLINTTTAALCYFPSCEAVPGGYLILSHVWGAAEQSFQDVQRLTSATVTTSVSRLSGTSSSSASSVSDPFSRLSPKIRGCCKFAASLGHTWAWMDMCCINKDSSAELSEALNSISVWYAKADICVAYLDDVPDGDDPWVRGSAFWRSRWFKRGWTLQELLCPPYVLFLSRGWARLGAKAALAPLIQDITMIDTDILTFKRPLASVSVARRMAWAADRVTSRIEDRAYSLMGIFGVNMPIIYGEGRNAFRRLQEEIMKVSPDQTLFAWGYPTGASSGLFATEPGDFRESNGMESIPLEEVPLAVEAFLTALTHVPQPTTGNKRVRSLVLWPLSPSLSYDGFQIRHESSLSLNPMRPHPIPPATPTFTMTSHGVLARLPIIKGEDRRGNVVAVLACKRRAPSVHPHGCYVGLVLHPSACANSLPHYATGIANSRTRLVLPVFLSAANLGFADDEQLSVTWAKVYISPRTDTGSAIPRAIKPHLPRWVRTHIRQHGFALDSGARTSALHWGDTLVLTFSACRASSSNPAAASVGKDAAAATESFQLHFRAGANRSRERAPARALGGRDDPRAGRHALPVPARGSRRRLSRCKRARSALAKPNRRRRHPLPCSRDLAPRDDSVRRRGAERAHYAKPIACRPSYVGSDEGTRGGRAGWNGVRGVGDAVGPGGSATGWQRTCASDTTYP